jgi:hypothetical protein
MERMFRELDNDLRVTSINDASVQYIKELELLILVGLMQEANGKGI